MPTGPAYADNTPGTTRQPLHYRHQGIARRLVPNTWGSVHAWIFVVFLVATFGPMFHLWADSNTLVAGWPISIAWILLWMILQTINLVAFYFTTVRPTADRIALETGVQADVPDEAPAGITEGQS